MGVTPKPMGHPSHLQNHSQSFLPHLNSSKQTAFISTSSPSLSLVSKTITKPSPCTKLRPENLCPHRHRVSITPLQRRLCPEHRHLWSLCRWLRNRRRNQHGWIPHKRSWQCRC